MEIKVIASSSKGNAYHVSDGQTQLLLECGVPVREIQKAIDFKLHKVSGCLISHEHMDHAKAAKDLIKKGIQVYASKGTLIALDLLGNHKTKRVLEMCEFKVGSFKVLPFTVEHDARDPLGFLIESEVTKEKLLFFTDTYYLKYKFRGLHYIMAECNYSTEIINKKVEGNQIHEALKDRIIGSHMSLETLMNFILACDLSHLKKVYLMHLSDSNSDAEEFKRQIQKLTGVEVEVC